MPSRFGQAEADVRRAARRVDLELLAQPADEREHLAAGRRHRADRHHQRVDDDVRARDAVIRGPLHDPLGDREPDVGVLADPGVVVADRHDRRAVLLDQRQDALEALLLAGDRVDQRLALVDREPGLERLDDRGVDRERQVGQRLDQLDGVGQDRGLVGERDAGVDVEHVGAGRDLGEDVALDPAEVAGLHLLGQRLATGRVDALADDDERAIEAEHDLAGGGAQDRLGHESASPRRGIGVSIGGRQHRPALDAAGLDQLGEAMLRVRRSRDARPRRRPRPRGRRRRRRCSRRHSSM